VIKTFQDTEGNKHEPASDTENGPNSVKFRFVFALTDIEGNVKEIRRDRFAGFAAQNFRFRFCRIAENRFNKIQFYKVTTTFGLYGIGENR
jgi:hypothetical protein